MADKALKERDGKDQATERVAARSSVLIPQSSLPGSDALLLDLCTHLLTRCQSVRFRAPGRSMYPTIREEEIITVDPVLPDDVRRGDILLCRIRESAVAHRVTRIERNNKDAPRFILRDDTWGSWDERVEAQQILGKVVSVERGGRTRSLYTTRVKMRSTVHVLASRLRRLIRRAFF